MKKDIKNVAVISSPNFNGNTASLARAVVALYLKPIFKKFIVENKEEKEHASYNSLHQRKLI